MRHDTNTNAEKEGQAQDIPKGTGGLRLENCWEGNGKALHSLGDASIHLGVSKYQNANDRKRGR